MSETIKVRVEGLSEVLRKMEQLERVASQEAVVAAGVKAMEPVAEDARANAPVRLGILRDSIRIAAQRPTSGSIIASIGITLSSGKIIREIPTEPGKFMRIPAKGAGWRWHWAELGTAHSAAHPFLLPALENNITKILAIFGAELKERIDQVVTGGSA